MDDLSELYEDVILDHNKSPRNFNDKPDPVTHHAHGDNPVCGDTLDVYLKVVDDRVEEITFFGQGCAISVASASLMTQSIKGKTVSEADAFFHKIHAFLTDQNSDIEVAEIGKLQVLRGVKKYPSRIKCATLSWHTLHAAMTGNDK
jgi:nitrogen fixation protein NifU and related proteins